MINLTSYLGGGSTDALKHLHVRCNVQFEDLPQSGTRVRCDVKAHELGHFGPMAASHTLVAHDTDDWYFVLFK